MNRKTTPYLILGIIVLCLTVLVLTWGLLRKSRLDSSSQDLAVNVTLAIFSNRNVAPLIDSAHSSLMQQYGDSADELRFEMLNYAEMLGRLELVESIVGATSVSLLPFSGPAPTASYELTTFFTVNPTSIYIEMTFEDKNWKITDYRVGVAQLDA